MENRTEKRGRAPFFGTFFLILLLTAGCDKSPSEPFARLVEQAASWAATARYTSELQRSGQVPHAYLQDVLKTGDQDLATLRAQLAKAKEIPQDVRDNAVGLTDDLRSLLSADVPDTAKLQQTEAQLRALADKVRQS